MPLLRVGLTDGACRSGAPLAARLLALSIAGLLAASCRGPSDADALARFRENVESLSEKGGYFDTDNLISNETAYVQVVGALEPRGGAYIGVGPEQNFHYIGRLRPSWAFIIDVRRDNMLHHLLLNAILVQAETPAQYLCWLFSRRCGDVDGGSFEEMVEAVEASEPDAVLFEEHLSRIFDHIESRLGMPLNDEERDVVRFIYQSFFEDQLALRFHSYGRAPMPYHPSYRGLLLAADGEGNFAHFLAREEDYAHVRELAATGHLIPVVGDFAGDHALRAIGRFLQEQGVEVTAFYLSNVEFYLLRSGRFDAFVENVRALPLSDSAELIRAYFSYGYPHPAALPGHRSTLVRQKAGNFLRLYDQGAYSSYWDVSALDYEQ